MANMFGATVRLRQWPYCDPALRRELDGTRAIVVEKLRGNALSTTVCQEARVGLMTDEGTTPLRPGLDAPFAEMIRADEMFEQFIIRAKSEVNPIALAALTLFRSVQMLSQAYERATINAIVEAALAARPETPD
jgi:hypothetical protein